ncbi:hypothetical protein CQY22_010960, partial [Mycolicibacterium brumae]
MESTVSEAVGLDAFICEIDGFVGTLIDQLAPPPTTSPPAVTVSPPALVAPPTSSPPGSSPPGSSVPGPPDGDDGSRRLFDLLYNPTRVFDEPRLDAVLVAAVGLRNLADHVLASATAAAERAGVPTRRHLRSGAQLLTGLGVVPGTAYRLARVGRAAHELPAVTQAQRLAGMGAELADAIGVGVAHIGARVDLDEQQRADVVATLMVQTTPGEVAKKARAIAIARTPDNPASPVPVAEDEALNEMTLTQGADGCIVGSFDLDVVAGEELHAALDALCRPVPGPDGSVDPRPVGKRRADGFAQVIRAYLSGYERPTSGGVLPHVSLIRPATTPSWGSAVEQSVDQLGFTGPVTKKTATLISCDATVDTILVDGAGAPLDVGRMQRLFSPRIRKALIARDGGCAFPGCGRPASWCDAHHIQAWEADGVTSVDNGVMLCRLFRYRNNRHYAESAVMPILRESVLVSGFSVEL